MISLTCATTFTGDVLGQSRRNQRDSRNEGLSVSGHSDDMTKRLFISRFNRQTGIVEGFVAGLADFGCLGQRFFDLAGYPYDDEAAALLADWKQLGADIMKARESLNDETVKNR